MLGIYLCWGAICSLINRYTLNTFSTFNIAPSDLLGQTGLFILWVCLLEIKGVLWITSHQLMEYRVRRGLTGVIQLFSYSAEVKGGCLVSFPTRDSALLRGSSLLP